MHHDQHPEHGTDSEEDEAVLRGGVVRIIDQESAVVAEDSDRLLEGDTVLAPVRGGLARISLEGELSHVAMYISCKYNIAGMPTVRLTQSSTASAYSPRATMIVPTWSCQALTRRPYRARPVQRSSSAAAAYNRTRR
ncbi:MAG TPA: hypothetical protein VIR34_00245, partial [Gemmatimonadaceae bacterium]